MSSSLNPFGVEYRTLRTRLAPEECCSRLEPLVIPWSSRMAILGSAQWASGRPLIGAVSQSGFALRKKIFYKNDLQIEASARFELAPDGTRMCVRLGTRRWVIFLCLWLSVITVVLGSVPYLCRAYPRSCHGNLPPSVAFGIPILAACILVLGRWLSRDDAEFLISFLKEKLNAEEVPETAFPAPALRPMRFH